MYMLNSVDENATLGNVSFKFMLYGCVVSISYESFASLDVVYDEMYDLCLE